MSYIHSCGREECCQVFQFVETSLSLVVKNLSASAGDIEMWVRFLGREDPRSGSGAQQPTPVFLPGEFCGQRSLVGSGPGSHQESDMTE